MLVQNDVDVAHLVAEHVVRQNVEIDIRVRRGFGCIDVFYLNGEKRSVDISSRKGKDTLVAEILKADFGDGYLRHDIEKVTFKRDTSVPKEKSVIGRAYNFFTAAEQGNTTYSVTVDCKPD